MMQKQSREETLKEIRIIEENIRALEERKRDLILHANLEEYLDVKDLYFCLFDDDNVALFKRIDYYTSDIVIFEGVQLKDKIGIKLVEEILCQTDNDYESFYHANYWYKKGEFAFFDKKTHTATCHIHCEVKVDEIMSILSSEKIIDDYIEGFATPKQMNIGVRTAASYLLTRKNSLHF